jgi:peptidoglycan hydrolase-like protein with peptidoglycan-binding domain
MKTLGRVMAAGLIVAAPLAVILSALPAQGADTTAAAAPAKSGAAKVTMNAKSIEHIQIGLARSGADVAIDGIWGPKTTQALRSFQKAHNLKVTGYPDRATMKIIDAMG